MLPLAPLDAATDRGINYLAAQQLTNGGFVSHSGPTLDASALAHTYHTTFFPSLILSAIIDIPHPGLQPIRAKLADFLQHQKSSGWSYNYWDRQAPEHSQQPYPDDLDDTFVALSALWRYQPSLFDGQVLAAITKLLVAAEQKIGGPYRTWLTADQTGQWADVDLAVNANIGYFLSLQGVQLPSIQQLIQQALDNQQLSSRYYPSVFPLVYYLARWQQGDTVGLRKMLPGPTQNSLHSALKAASLLYMGASPVAVESLIQQLLQQQRADGSWPAYAYCLDPARSGTTHYASSPALTTALCLEAIHLYRRHSARPQSSSNSQYRQAIGTIERDITAITSVPLRQQVGSLFQRIQQQDTDQQIAMLPHLVQRASGLSLPPSTVSQLSAASLWGWMAYTALDDVMDGDSQPNILPAATFSARRLLLHLHAALPDSFEFQHEAQSVLDDTDAANSWELANCRGTVANGHLQWQTLPDYGDYWPLAARSFGHALSGLGVLYGAGLARNAPAMRCLRTFFRHYLIARQLNDDAHDWQTDLKRGHINAAATLAIRHWQESTGSHATTLALDNLDQLQAIFWDRTIERLCRDIHHHVQAACQALAATDWPHAQLLEALVTPLGRSADAALAGRQQAADFIASL